MMTFNEIQYKHRFWVYLLLTGLVLCVFWLLLRPTEAKAGTLSDWLDFNFEDFDDGELIGQNGWTATEGTGAFTIQNTNTYNSDKSVYIDWLTSSYRNAIYNPDPIDGTTGEESIVFYIKMIDGAEFLTISAENENYDKLFHLVIKHQGGTSWRFETSGDPLFEGQTFKENEWLRITWNVDWDLQNSSIEVYNLTTPTDFGEHFFREGEDEVFSVKRFMIHTYNAEAYFEGFAPPAPAGASVWGDDPESTTEITDLESILTVGYEGLGNYDDLYIALRHPQTGLFTSAKNYKISEIGESGELEITLSDFDLDRNGNWYLHASAVYEGYQYQGGFLSGYGSVWTDDLTDGDYYLDISIEGFQDVFAMSDFTSWYSENSKFDEPTEMFEAIAEFFSPIFSKIGEFGNRISDYFDTNTANAKGYEIGKSIPLFTYYLGQISVFMGSFPLMNWLLVIILLLVGIFIFKVIFKFIPFLG